MELYCPRRFSIGAVFWACVAVALLVLAAAIGKLHPAIAALAPAMLAAGLVLGRRREFRCVLSQEGLDVQNPAQTIPFSEIEGVTINGIAADADSPRLKRGAVIVAHRRGVLEIPAGLNARADKVYQAILAMVPTTGSGQLSPKFDEHLQKETATFGAERVHAFSRRAFLGRRPSTRRGQLCAVLLLACGVLWCFVPALITDRRMAREYEPWLGLGIVLSIFSVLGWLFLYLRQLPMTGSPRRFKNAELIVSPTGIAVKHDDLEGHLRWDELVDVKSLNRQVGFVTVSNGPIFNGIQIVIAGARIDLGDVYDRPIALIHQLIRRYWKGE